MARINKIGHVVLSVTNVTQSAKFYQNILGMEIVRMDDLHRMVFLSFGTQHHDLALFKAKSEFIRYKHSMIDGYYEPSRGTLGLAHIAMQVVGDMHDLRQLYDKLIENKIEVRLTDHGMTKSMYFNDPDGNEIELFIETMTPLRGKRYMADGHGSTSFTFDDIPTRPEEGKDELEIMRNNASIEAALISEKTSHKEQEYINILLNNPSTNMDWGR